MKHEVEEGVYIHEQGVLMVLRNSLADINLITAFQLVRSYMYKLVCH